MKVKVVGKQHREGVSKKSGKEYSMNLAYCEYSAKDVEGVMTGDFIVPDSLVNFSSIVVGGVYIFDFDNRGYLVSVSKA